MSRADRRPAGIISIVITVLLVLIILMNLYCIWMKNVRGERQPLILGYTYAVVMSGSMSGTFEAGDIVIVHREDDYSIGDVIMFDTGDTFVTHRIAAETDEGLVTRGDANDADDPAAVAYEDVTGRVTASVPYIGRAVLFLQTPLGMLLMTAGAVLMIEVPYRLGRRKR